MHVSRVTESELCFRKINTVTVYQAETLVRMLDICLGINPSEPHAHGFYHQLACKHGRLYSLCDSRSVFPAPYRARPPTCPASFLTRCSQSRAHHFLSPTAPHTATPLPAPPHTHTPYTPRYATVLRPEFSFSSTSPTPFSHQPHGPSNHHSHSSQILPRLHSFSPLLSPPPFCPYWTVQGQAISTLPLTIPAAWQLVSLLSAAPFLHSSNSLSKLNLNLIMVFLL